MHLVARCVDAPYVIEALAGESVDVDALDGLGWTPLRLACRAGYAGSVQALLLLGATDLIR